MAYRDLREFVRALEKADELRRISIEVDPVLEITEITHRITRAGGPALLFEHPKGSRIPLLINMLGSERRINLALGVHAIDEVAARIRSHQSASSGTQMFSMQSHRSSSLARGHAPRTPGAADSHRL